MQLRKDLRIDLRKDSSFSSHMEPYKLGDGKVEADLKLYYLVKYIWNTATQPTDLWTCLVDDD